MLEEIRQLVELDEENKLIKSIQLSRVGFESLLLELGYNLSLPVPEATMLQGSKVVIEIDPRELEGGE